MPVAEQRRTRFAVPEIGFQMVIIGEIIRDILAGAVIRRDNIALLGQHGNGIVFRVELFPGITRHIGNSENRTHAI